VTDRDDDRRDCRYVFRVAVARCDGAQQRERLDVDAGKLQARRPARLDVVVDRLLIGGREQDAP
jgi:hypothetical protein